MEEDYQKLKRTLIMLGIFALIGMVMVILWNIVAALFGWRAYRITWESAFVGFGCFFLIAIPLLLAHPATYGNPAGPMPLWLGIVISSGVTAVTVGVLHE